MTVPCRLYMQAHAPLLRAPAPAPGPRAWLPLLAPAPGSRARLPLPGSGSARLAPAPGSRSWLPLLAPAPGSRSWLRAPGSICKRMHWQSARIKKATIALGNGGVWWPMLCVAKG